MNSLGFYFAIVGATVAAIAVDSGDYALATYAGIMALALAMQDLRR